MGLHAFDAEPGHCTLYRHILCDALPPLQGFTDRWNVLAAEHEATLPEGSAFPGVDHYIVTVQLNDAPVRRTDDPRFDATAQHHSISLQRPNSGGSFRSDGLVRYAHLYFKQSLLCELGDSLGLGTAAELDDVFAFNEPQTAEQIVAYVNRAATRQDRPTGIEMDSRSYLIALDLLRHLDARERTELRPVSALQPRRLRDVVELIETDMGAQLRLSELAGAAGLSPFHFSRAFKQTTGSTPAAYVMRRRVERAVNLIGSSSLGLAEIAHRTGFSSQSHMTRAVKGQTGHTPGAIRRTKT